MNNVIDITDGNDLFILQDLDITKIDKSSEYYIIFFKMSWCKYCNIYEPTLKDIANKYPQYTFLIIELTFPNNEKIINNFNELINPKFIIDSYPKLLLYNNDGTFNQLINKRSELESILRSL
jgi:thiol-disulfide isomerase/thioredoxin